MRVYFRTCVSVFSYVFICVSVRARVPSRESRREGFIFKSPAATSVSLRPSKHLKATRPVSTSAGRRQSHTVVHQCRSTSKQQQQQHQTTTTPIARDGYTRSYIVYSFYLKLIISDVAQVDVRFSIFVFLCFFFFQIPVERSIFLWNIFGFSILNAPRSPSVVSGQTAASTLRALPIHNTGTYKYSKIYNSSYQVQVRRRVMDVCWCISHYVPFEHRFHSNCVHL